MLHKEDAVSANLSLSENVSADRSVYDAENTVLTLRLGQIRFEGCNCQGSQPCEEKEESDCPCRVLQRECDPELCLSCDARCSKGMSYSVFCDKTMIL